MPSKSPFPTGRLAGLINVENLCVNAAGGNALLAGNAFSRSSKLFRKGFCQVDSLLPGHGHSTTELELQTWRNCLSAVAQCQIGPRRRADGVQGRPRRPSSRLTKPRERFIAVRVPTLGSLLMFSKKASKRQSLGAIPHRTLCERFAVCLTLFESKRIVSVPSTKSDSRETTGYRISAPSKVDKLGREVLEFPDGLTALLLAALDLDSESSGQAGTHGGALAVHVAVDLLP